MIDGNPMEKEAMVMFHQGDDAEGHRLQDAFARAFQEEYRSMLPANALIASMLAWSERYNVHNYFCSPNTTGKLVYKILYYAMKERLERGDAG